MGVNSEQGVPRTVVAITASYKVSPQDDLISVGTLAGAITITLPSAPQAGDQYDIVDTKGSAGGNNITVNGGGHNLKGAATLVMSVNFQSIRVTFDQTAGVWAVQFGVGVAS